MPPFLEILSGILDFFLPRACPLCDASLPFGSDRALCEPCLGALERTPLPWCPNCGKPFRSEATLTHSPAHICAECRDRPPHFDTARALGPYDGSLRELIHLIKFRGYTSLATEMGAELARLAKHEFPDIVGAENGLVTYVPIDRERWRERCFDQARLIALSAATHLEMTFSQTLERKVSAQPQTRLSASSRRKNLRGVFAATSPNCADQKKIILIDDVLTTGSTASACAQVLRKSGAITVAVLTICHTVVQELRTQILQSPTL